MLPRAASHLLLGLGKAVEEGNVTSRIRWRKCMRNAFRCSSSLLNTLPRVTTVSNKDLWLQHRVLQQAHHQHFHHPFSIARMYSSSSLFPPAQHPSPVSVSLLMLPDPTFKECHIRLYSSKPPPVPSSSVDENHNERKMPSAEEEKVVRKLEKTRPSEKTKAEEKLSIVQKFKLMYKQYWYVLIPVHVVTSIVWYGSFFIAAKSGVDIIPLMEKLGAGESITSHLRNSNAGYYAIAYAMYKIATPARYTVTVGGTTISINYLKKYGYIKPVPSPEQLKEMYEGKKEEFIERKDEFVEKYQERKEEIVDRYQEKREEFMDRYQEKRDEIKEKYQEKREEFREKVAEQRDMFKDRLEEKKEQLSKVRDSMKKR